MRFQCVGKRKKKPGKTFSAIRIDSDARLATDGGPEFGVIRSSMDSGNEPGRSLRNLVTSTGVDERTGTLKHAGKTLRCQRTFQLEDSRMPGKIPNFRAGPRAFRTPSCSRGNAVVECRSEGRRDIRTSRKSFVSTSTHESSIRIPFVPRRKRVVYHEPRALRQDEREPRGGCSPCCGSCCRQAVVNRPGGHSGTCSRCVR